MKLKEKNIQTLILDDDKSILFLHELIVKESNFSKCIHAFDSGKKGFEYLNSIDIRDKPCIIFLDINMPGMDGWEFLEELERQDLSSNIYVVMVTSSIDKSDKMKASRYSRVIHYAEKPLTIEECQNIMHHSSIIHLFQ